MREQKAASKAVEATQVAVEAARARTPPNPAAVAALEQELEELELPLVRARAKTIEIARKAGEDKGHAKKVVAKLQIRDATNTLMHARFDRFDHDG